jgi:hypothetical protein
MIAWLDLYLVQKAPFQLPPDVREWIVTYGPWITLVLMVLAVPVLLLALGIGALGLPFGGVGFAAGFSWLTLMVIVTFGLRAMALPGLFARKISGWTLVFYAQLLSFAFSVLSGSIVFPAIGLLLSLYVLFQVRPLYHE